MFRAQGSRFGAEALGSTLALGRFVIQGVSYVGASLGDLVENSDY